MLFHKHRSYTQLINQLCFDLHCPLLHCYIYNGIPEFKNQWSCSSTPPVRVNGVEKGSVTPFYHGNFFWGLETMTVVYIKSTFHVSAWDVIQSGAEPNDIFDAR